MKNQSRSLGEDFDEGATDGTYKKIIQNQTEIVRDPNRRKRDQLSWRYGLQEAFPKFMPDDGAVAREYPTRG